MVAAVAFSGVLTSTQPAHAQAPDDSTATPGQTVTLTWTGGSTATVYFRISTDSSASGTFVANGGQSIRCVDDTRSCDGAITNTSADPPINTGTVSLRFKIDEDSPFGELFVQRYSRVEGAVGTISETVVTVIPANPPAAIKAGNRPPAAMSQDTPSEADGGALIIARIVNSRGSGIGGVAVQVTTTRGGLSRASAVTYAAANPPAAEIKGREQNAEARGTTCPVPTANAAGNASCALVSTAAAGADTDQADDDREAGLIAVLLKGNGGGGAADVTFRHLASGHTYTATVTLHGDAASLSAEVDQSTIGINNSTFIVVTVTDIDGNPVGGVTDIDVRNHALNGARIAGPEVPAGNTANLVADNRNVDRNLGGVANDLPACGDDDSADLDTTPGVDEGASNIDASAGTNSAGKCVIQVSAPAGAAPPSTSATRGTHVITVGALSSLIPTVSVDVEVGGSPASIETDAPARVDSLSSTSISVTVLDDEGVRVGAVPITVVQVEGNGNQDDPPGGMTSDGRAAFNFLAPLSEGEAVFLIRAGGPGQVIQSTITLAIGDAPEEAPDAPPATWSKDLVAGNNLVVWNGDNDADPADGAAEGVVSIWSLTAAGWEGYFPTAADVPGGNNLDSLTNGEAYFVVVE